MRVAFTPVALQDLREIGAYFMRHNPGIGSLFTDRLLELTDRLARFPNAGRATSSGMRRVTSVPGFPYQVFYRTVAADEVRFMRVRHARRRPLSK